MSSSIAKLALRGSIRSPLRGAKRLERSNAKERISISIFARRNPRPAPEVFAKAAAVSSANLAQRVYLTLAEFDDIYGASPQDLAAIEAFAQAAKLRIVDSSVSKRRVLAEGAIESVEKAFNVSLHEYKDDRIGRFRGREGEIYVPEHLEPIIAGVEGLDTRPAGRPRLARARVEPISMGALGPGGDLGAQFPGCFLPTQVAALYNYPSEFNGAGQKIGILAFNGGRAADQSGGYDVNSLQTYFANLIHAPIPAIADIVVRGRGNEPGPGTPQSSRRGDTTQEIMLDVSVAGSVAPGASLFVYFSDFSCQGWIEALQEAITDDKGLSVISVSYGNPEDDPKALWTRSGMKLLNEAFEAAGSRGITVCCASGDYGSDDQVSRGAHADFPASSPWVLGVGGTRLTATRGADPKIASEAVWNDVHPTPPRQATGGGVSAIFSLPSYQYGAGVPRSANPPHCIGRGVPDVAAVADASTGLIVAGVGNQITVLGGTSVGAPLWAALVARINQALGTRAGFLNPTLYASCSKGILNDIMVGDNGIYQAGVGWDACTGLGSPNGTKLLHALMNAAAAA